MSRYQLLATAFVASLCSSIVSAETFDDYLSQLARHPSVTHIIEQGNSFENLATSALSLPDPQLILGVDNIPFSDPSFDRFLPSAKVIGFRQAIPNPAVRKKRASFQKSQSKKLPPKPFSRVVSQRTFGPPSLKLRVRPVSLDTPVRSGPWNCGQSLAVRTPGTRRAASPRKRVDFMMFGGERDANQAGCQFYRVTSIAEKVDLVAFAKSP